MHGMTRRLSLAAAMAVATLLLTASWAPAQAIRNVPRISVEELKTLIAENKVLLVDTRIEGEFLMGHIPGAINISFMDADWRAKELKGEKRQIVTYCA
jgi:3-mercaptopyruvate sulfurtransferase SseA